MAKKKQVLPVEELLEQALVPKSEKSNVVPENWVWTRLGNVTTIIGGGTPPSRVIEYYENGSIPWISPVDLSGYTDIYISHGKKNITELGLKKSSARLLPENTVLLSSRAPIGYVAIADNELCTNQGFKSFLPSPCYLPKYLYFYLKSSKKLLEAYASGTTFLELSGRKAAIVEFPLPPLAEQQRIVDRIESLFEKLNQAKALIQDALDSFENRKAAILHKAFSGELTEKWREENGVGMGSWKKKSIKEVVKFRAGYAFDSKNFSSTGHQVIRMGNLYNGVLDLTRNPVYISPDLIDNSIIKRFSINEGDILLTLTGTKYKRDYGYAVLIKESENLLLNQRILSLTPESIETNYLLYYLQSDFFRDVFFSNETGGVNQGNVSSKFVEKIEIPIFSSLEQKEIVRILDYIFEKDKNANQLCDLIDNIDLMKKSILARAFRGELGTNNPEEESAMELLKDILSGSAGESR
ncbi:restriction modification system DNA specificity domain [Alkaliphilus metalliredigens QYMF]|uniref:Restriction modification system DNA specificity domain n=1 Tax=Alkaliphilus metalliredigens (strain QYMF) TaxID=293826 RepID=A6TLK6_ALKMQ|nr:restriction endonuclease subunit S [Alkaliphilus metalliredigens]ABR47074.1 restriction modification system DNA specificity domain [Alkaliphilus metalliredigens QYMF]